MILKVAFIAMCLVIGYILGTISTAYIVGKKKNIDIREHGSKNAGTTNAMRTMGRTAGIIVFLGDCIKTVLAILIMLGIGMFLKIDMDPETIKLATGLGVVLGHNFPFWMGFKGGKGIAVTSAVIVAFCFNLEGWWCILVLLALFIAIVKFSKYVSLGSLAVVTGFLIYVATNFSNHVAYIRLLVFTLLLTLLAYFMHRQNIVRLLHGTENKIGQKKADTNVAANNRMNSGMNNGMNAGMNNGMNNGMNAGMNNGMNNGMNAGMNNGMNMQQGNRVNNMILEPSDLVNVNNIGDFNNSGNYIDNKTEQLYNTSYFDGIKNQQGNTNDVNINNGNNAYYKSYDACDTLDETRQLQETEYLDETDSYNGNKSYYEK